MKSEDTEALKDIEAFTLYTNGYSDYYWTMAATLARCHSCGLYTWQQELNSTSTDVTCFRIRLACNCIQSMPDTITMWRQTQHTVMLKGSNCNTQHSSQPTFYSVQKLAQKYHRSCHYLFVINRTQITEANLVNSSSSRTGSGV